MDFFNRISNGSSVAGESSISSTSSCLRSTDSQRTKEYSLRYLKAILAGPQKSARTSLLFEVAFQYAEKGHTVLFITPRKVTRLPILLRGCKYPSVEVLKKIQMVHLATANEFLEFLALIHLKYKDPVRLLIVNDLDIYYRGAEKHKELALLARIYAVLLDAATFLGQKRNQETNDLQFCSVVCSIVTANEANSQIPNKSMLKMWFNDFITLKNEEIGNPFEAMIEQEASSGEIEQHRLEFLVTDQNMELYSEK